MPKTKSEEPVSANADTAARPMTKHIRDYVRQRFASFLKEASIGEIIFMKDVLVWRDSAGIYGPDELGIANAFETALDRPYCDYLRVPEKHRHVVRQYIEDLKTGKIAIKHDSAEGPNAPAMEVKLPRSIRLSADERAQVARLIRLLRDNYWVGELIRQILAMESQTRHQLTIKTIAKLLDNFDTIEALANNARQLGANWSNHPILKAIRDEREDIQDYQNERTIQALVDSAEKK
jgi:hypothetical protein